MDQTGALTDYFRDWYDNSPTAKRAYARFRADIDTVVTRAQPKVREFWDQIGPLIDPPAKDADKGGDDSANTSGRHPT